MAGIALPVPNAVSPRHAALAALLSAGLSFGALSPVDRAGSQEPPPPPPAEPTATEASPRPSAPEPGTPPAAPEASSTPTTPETGPTPTTPETGTPPAAPEAGTPPAVPEAGTTPATPEPGTTPAAPEAGAADRAAAYRTFREHFDARRFAEALPAAQQVVDLTEQRYGKDASELVAPLSNLGVTKLRLNDTNGAALQFQRAVKIVESHQGGFSREIIAPLFGLGVTYAAAGDYTASAESLRRAVDVSRKLDGLFNINQLTLVETLVATYVALNQFEEAEREQQYALRLAESAYGRYDPRLIPMLERSASWLERTGHFVATRQTYARALEIARKAGGDDDPRMVTPLRGISRMYRMEYLYGVEPATAVGLNNPQAAGSVFGTTTAPVTAPVPGMLNDAGEEALKLALGVIDKHPEIAPAQRGDTLVDLGDWYMVAGKTREAMRTYKDAWAALSAPGAKGTAALDTPVAIIYRPPSSARRNPTVDPEEYTEGFVDVEFMVTPEGRVKDPALVTDDMPESVGRSVVSAIRRARYRPRFVDGAPVQTTGVRHRQTVFLRTKSEA